MLLICAVLLSGCTTLQSSRSSERVRTEATLDQLTAKVERLEARIDHMAGVQQDIYQEMQALRKSTDRSSAETEKRVNAAAQSMRGWDARMTEMRKEIVDTLSGKMAGMISATSTGHGGTRSESGYEHVVQDGETLSAIAGAYGVSLDAIIKANNIRNPNAVRVGQKLFIPE